MERTATQLESVEAIQAVLRKNALRRQPHRSPTEHEAQSQRASPPARFRPTVRPPMAVVTVLFDGLDQGDKVPVWSRSCIIGRTGADINVPLDSQMSSRHFELYLPEKFSARWRVRDLGSTNGTFARVSDALLDDGTEFLLGACRYRFLGVDSAGEEGTRDPGHRNTTQAWQIAAVADEIARAPAIVEVTASGATAKQLITKREIVLGKSTNSCDVIVDDKFVDERHARIYCDEHNRWYLANLESLNGTWVRFDELAIDHNAQIQAGEQRFQIWVS